MLPDPIRRALDDLEHDGTLTPAQRATVAARLASAVGAPRDRTAVFTSIVAIFGALLVFAGLTLLVVLEWWDIPRLARVAIPIVVLLAVHHLAFVCAESPGRFPRVGAALRMLGVLAFGPALVLIGSVYRLESEYLTWIPTWALLAVPFAVRERSPWIAAIAATLLGIWGFLFTGIWLLHHRHSGLDPDTTLVLLLLAESVLFKGVRALLAASRLTTFEAALRSLTPPLTIGGLLALAHRGAYDGVAAGSIGWDTFTIPGIVALAGLLALVVAARRAEARFLLLEGSAVALAALVAALAIRFQPSLVVPLGNLALLAALVAIIAIGVYRGIPSYVNLGILGVLVTGSIRYAEYLAERFAGAVAFLVAGVLLLAFGTLLERRRRRWVDAARRNAT